MNLFSSNRKSMGRLYSKLKIFNYPDKLASLPARVAQTLAPIHVRIKPTNVCNHRCRYCAYREDNLQLGQDMNAKATISWEKMDAVIDDFDRMGVAALTFSGGGEPFCYPHILKALKKLSDTTISFAALTNGSRLENETAEIFAHHGKWIRVSMDGWDGPSYAAYRNVDENAFQRVMKNMENFNLLGGRCLLGVSIIVDRDNADHIEELIQRIHDIGAHSVKVSPCVVDNDGYRNNQYHRPLFDRVKEQIGRAQTHLASRKFEIFDAYHALDEKFKKNYTWCPFLQILPVIGADLNVYTCQDKAYNLENGSMGSIADKDFKTFWLQNREKFFQINPSIDCNHHCVANTKNKMILEFLDIDAGHGAFV